MSNSAERAAAGIAEWALRIMPARDKLWAEGMAAELAYCEPGLRALGFALGCLGAALRRRVWSALLRPESRLMLAAAGAGLLFVAHAAVDGSGAWPLLWPLAAGAASTFIPEREADRVDDAGRSSLRRCWRAVRAGSATGAVMSVIFAAGSIAFLLTAGDVPLKARLPVLVAGATIGLALSGIGALACSLARERLSGPR